MSRPDPLEQLTRLRIDTDDQRRTRDLEAIRTDLRRVPPPAPSTVPRRWTLGVVVAMILAGPAAAVAGDDAVPGDLLYPIKRAVEPIVQLFDRDIVVEHRVEEVAVLVDRGVEDRIIEERIDVARDALTERAVPGLQEELDRIVDAWVTDRTLPDVTDEPPVTTSPRDDDPSTLDRQPASAPESTTGSTDRAREQPPSDRTTTTSSTTSVSITDGDGPTSDDRPRDSP